MANQQESSATRVGNGDRGSLSAKSHEAAEHVKEAMVGQVDQARQRAQSAREQTAERLRRVAGEIRRAGETLQPEDELVARLAQRASRGVERMAGYVSSAELRRLRSDTERFARTRPGLFFGGAFLAGLALGRFFRSTPNGVEGTSAGRERHGRSSGDVPRPERAPLAAPLPREGEAS